VTHVDDAILAEMRDGTLAPRALLDADDHLAACERCRARFAEIMAMGSFVAEVDAYAKGRPRAIGRLVAGLAAALVVATGVWWLSRAARPDSGAALMASVDAANGVVHDGGRDLSLDASGQLRGGQGLSSRDSGWTVDALRGVPLRDGSTTGPAPEGHLVKGALAERSGDWPHAAEEYRALREENPASAFVARLLARVSRHR